MESHTVDFNNGKLTVDLYRKRVVLSVDYDDHYSAMLAYDALTAMLRKGGAQVRFSTKT